MSMTKHTNNLDVIFERVKNILVTRSRCFRFYYSKPFTRRNSQSRWAEAGDIFTRTFIAIFGFVKLFPTAFRAVVVNRITALTTMPLPCVFANSRFPFYPFVAAFLTYHTYIIPHPKEFCNCYIFTNPELHNLREV